LFFTAVVIENPASAGFSFIWPLSFGGGISVRLLSKNRSLRHILVALLLRHPWLRTFLEGPATPMLLNSEL
jgi:hypothetical protein